MLHQLLVRVCQLVHSIDEGRDLATIDWKLETNNFDDSTVRHIVHNIWDDTTAVRAADHIKAAARMWCSPPQAAAITAAVDWELLNRHFMDKVDDDIDTWPVGAPSIPHEQPAPLPATQPKPTRRQGRPTTNFLPSAATEREKEKELKELFLARHNTLTIPDCKKNAPEIRTVIEMVDKWQKENLFPTGKVSGTALVRFLKSIGFSLGVNPDSLSSFFNKNI